MYYLIKEVLEKCTEKDIASGDYQYVITLNQDEWSVKRSEYGSSIDLDLGDMRYTKAIVNHDYLTGTFSIPRRNTILNDFDSFAFALDGRGIILICDSDYIDNVLESIRLTKKWSFPSLERFLYDLIEFTIAGDTDYLADIELKLNSIEDKVEKDEIELFPPELNDLRGSLLDLKAHYRQLTDLCQEFEENENEFFKDENLRYFRLIMARVDRLYDTLDSQREYISQIRDLIQNRLSEKQNRIMTLLTVITTIFIPLTLITGWYGMNFKYMPELNYRISYPLVLVVCILIAVSCLIYFKKKKWM